MGVQGRFAVRGQFDTGKSVDLDVEIKPPYVGRGDARRMVAAMCGYLRESGIRKDQMLFIDTDASGGFWRHIGMSEHRYSGEIRRQRLHPTVVDREGIGHELMITYSDLCNWAIGDRLGAGVRRTGRRARSRRRRARSRRGKARKVSRCGRKSPKPFF